MAATLKALNTQYPELVEALERQTAERFIADGEVVALENGQTSFARLQGRMQLSNPDAARRTGIAVFLYLFDLPQQELVIVGFTDPRGSRRGLGALLVGHYDRGSLRYAGKVGTGFSEATWSVSGSDSSGASVAPRRSTAAGSASAGSTGCDPSWWRRSGSRWTRDGRLRHPRYLGLRTDKPARKVVRERPTALGARSR
jgi:ATP-dependent DNA ligase